MFWEDSGAIIIFAAILLISIVIILLVNRYQKRYEETQNLVVTTSKRYAYMLKQKEIIQPEKLDAVYTINRYMNSKAQLDRLNLYNQMINIIQGDPEIQDTIYKCQKNIDLKVIYDNNLQNAPNYSNQEMGFSRLYLKIEHKLSNAISDEICPIIPQFHIYFRYTSPQGRNSYYINYEFSAEEMVDCLKLCEIVENNKQTAIYQRSIMTPALRYDVMKRDGFRCVLCGRSASDGIKLHVDHIVPIARGGKTIKSNLRTLCEDCNLGKKDKYDQDGIN